MIILYILHDSMLGFSAIFFCIGFGMLFLRKAVSGEAGPGCWAVSFFLNSAGFLFWSGTVTSSPWLFFILGEAAHMLGFIILVCGAYRFTGNGFRRWNFFALGGLAFVWIGSVSLMPQYRHEAFFTLMVLRAILFLWAGRMILLHISPKEQAGRELAGWGLLAWGCYILLFPFIWRLQGLIPLALGLLAGLHLLAAIGLVILVVDRLRIRAEASEKHAQRLEGLLPICSSCKKIRDGNDNWHNIETYIRERSDAEFTHGICPECIEIFYPQVSIYANANRK